MPRKKVRLSSAMGRQQTIPFGGWMATFLAMERIVNSSEAAPRPLPNVTWLPELKSLLSRGSNPAHCLIFVLCKCPGQVFNLDQLSQQRSCPVVVALVQKHGDTSRKLARYLDSRGKTNGRVASEAKG